MLRTVFLLTECNNCCYRDFGMLTFVFLVLINSMFKYFISTELILFRGTNGVAKSLIYCRPVYHQVTVPINPMPTRTLELEL